MSNPHVYRRSPRNADMLTAYERLLERRIEWLWKNCAIAHHPVDLSKEVTSDRAEIELAMTKDLDV